MRQAILFLLVTLMVCFGFFLLLGVCWILKILEQKPPLLLGWILSFWRFRYLVFIIDFWLGKLSIVMNLFVIIGKRFIYLLLECIFSNSRWEGREVTSFFIFLSSILVPLKVNIKFGLLNLYLISKLILGVCWFFQK